MFNKLQIIEDKGGKQVLCKCLLCGNEKMFKKSAVVCGNTYSCGCKSALVRDKVGNVYNYIEILEDNGKNIVLCKCKLCGKVDEYPKRALVSKGITCKYCGLGKNYKGKVINDIRVLKYKYKGRDGKKYYDCECIHCGEKLILNREDIVHYRCNKS